MLTCSMNEIYLTFTASSVCLCGVCSPWSVREVVVVSYVMVAVTVMHAMLFVLRVCVCVCAARR